MFQIIYNTPDKYFFWFIECKNIQIYFVYHRTLYRFEGWLVHLYEMWSQESYQTYLLYQNYPTCLLYLSYSYLLVYLTYFTYISCLSFLIYLKYFTNISFLSLLVYPSFKTSYPVNIKFIRLFNCIFPCLPCLLLFIYSATENYWTHTFFMYFLYKFIYLS